ncbi:MAG: exosortase/archaeosortase family protein [Candidatus Symbiothrix sp.]|jgi:exosortase/archaeosortase family protein|nr:exosortase/archaeosortase family protein [Candidatus Symbiothrix sp.]
MNRKLITWWKQLAPYKGILSFLFLLFFFWFAWEILVDGQLSFIHFPWEIPEKERDYYWFFLGKDVTPDWAFVTCRWLTDAAAWFVRLFPNTQDLIIDDIYMAFPENGRWKIAIVLGCSGIKQMSIFCCIMLFYRLLPLAKYQWNKLWYIPLGCVILTIYNIIRIGSTVLLTKGHPEKFDSLHDGIFRYIYYTIIFILWVVWEEVYVKKALKVHGTRVHGARK